MSSKLSQLPAVVELADADNVYIINGGVSKKTTLSLVKSFLKTYFDGLYGDEVDPAFTAWKDIEFPAVAGGDVYKAVLDETNSQWLFYKNSVHLTTVAYDSSGDFFPIDDNFSCAYISGNYIDIVFLDTTTSNLENLKWDFSEVFDKVELGTYLDIYMWDSAYLVEIFAVTLNVLGEWQGLNETYLTWSDVDIIATGLNYQAESIVTPLKSSDVDANPTEDSDNVVRSGGLFTALSAKLDKSGGVMTGAITSFRETGVALPANDIALSGGNLFSKTITTDTTFTVSNIPTSGQVSSFILELTDGGSSIVTWFSGVKWEGGVAPILTTSGVDILGFYTKDGGTTWRGVVLALDSK